MAVQINKEDYAKPWRPGIYPKSTTVIYNNQLWILNDTITGLFSSSDFLAEVANGDWIGRYTTEQDSSTKEDLSNNVIDFTTINDTLYPSVEAVKEQLDLKLDKSTTPSSVYTTDVAGLQVMKPLSDFKDVLEFANLATFPSTGESGKIYVALDTNLTYRWSGSVYVIIGKSVSPLVYYKKYNSTSGLKVGVGSYEFVDGFFCIPANTLQAGDRIEIRGLFADMPDSITNFITEVIFSDSVRPVRDIEGRIAISVNDRSFAGFERNFLEVVNNTTIKGFNRGSQLYTDLTIGVNEPYSSQYGAFHQNLFTEDTYVNIYVNCPIIRNYNFKSFELFVYRNL